MNELIKNNELLSKLYRANELKIIDTPLDINLEIPHLAYIEVKKEDSKALLFTRPIDKSLNKSFDIPVLMNVFGSHSRLKLLIDKNPESIAKDIQNLIEFTPPKGLRAITQKLKDLLRIYYTIPKKTKRARVQEIVQESVNLLELPILKTWEHDGGAFITMGQVYTTSLDGNKKNLGMYRLQVYDENHLGMHWQIHKDSNHFFHEYKKAGKKMPVSVALGGDPLYIWCGQAPLPYGIYELMLYGFIRGKRPNVCKSLTNEIYVPSDVDIVIEGFADPSITREEGPFGDHTGFYTSIESYPVMEVTKITMRKNAIFPATVTGKPPIEDKYMGYLTERVFLPIFKPIAHGLLDYCMPENGVFHNLILAKISAHYPAHAHKIAHAFWGTGQMSFVKHAIFLPDSAPELRDYQNLCEFILNRFELKNLFFSSGVCDALDHASERFGISGKVCLMVEDRECEDSIKALSDEALLHRLQGLSDVFKQASLRQHFTYTKSPLCFIKLKRTKNLKNALSELDFSSVGSFIKIVFLLDEENNLENLYMLTWRICNNIDVARDVWIKDGILFVDACAKPESNYLKEWPEHVVCNPEVIAHLKTLGLLDVSQDFMKKFEILE